MVAVHGLARLLDPTGPATDRPPRFVVTLGADRSTAFGFDVDRLRCFVTHVAVAERQRVAARRKHQAALLGCPDRFAVLRDVERHR